MNGLPVSFVLPDDLFVAIAEHAAKLVLEHVGQQLECARYLSVDQAAEYLACPRSRIYDLKARGRLRCCQDGRRLLFRREWLDEALDRPK